MTKDDLEKRIAHYHQEVREPLVILWDKFDSLFEGKDVIADWDDMLQQVANDNIWLKVYDSEGKRYQISFHLTEKKWEVMPGKKK